MAYIKLDKGILNSSVWYDRDVRDVFLTCLLMADLHETTEPMPQLAARSLDKTGWVVPPGWYGFVRAAGVAIVLRTGVEKEAGLSALEKMGSPDLDSQADDFDGRRLVRIDGGYVVLNYVRYFEKDHGAAERMRRYRLRLKAKQAPQDTSRDFERLGRLAVLDRSKP